MNSKKISDEEFEKLSFGKEKIAIEIPQNTYTIVITTVSQAINGGTNVQTRTYDESEIKSFKLKEYYKESEEN